MPWVSLEEAEVIEEASRRVGKEPAQFIKDAGLAVALAVLDGKAEQGRGHKPPLASAPKGGGRLPNRKAPQRSPLVGESHGTRLQNGGKESPHPRSLLSACLSLSDSVSGTSEWRKYCVSGATNIHRKYCVDGFR